MLSWPINVKTTPPPSTRSTLPVYRANTPCWGDWLSWSVIVWKWITPGWENFVKKFRVCLRFWTRCSIRVLTLRCWERVQSPSTWSLTRLETGYVAWVLWLLRSRPFFVTVICLRPHLDMTVDLPSWLKKIGFSASTIWDWFREADTFIFEQNDFT